MIVAGSLMLLVTVKVKSTLWPVSGTRVSSAVLVTLMSVGTSLNTIVSESVAVSSLASSSTALAVNVLTWLPPASPLTVRVIVKSQRRRRRRTVPTLQSASPAQRAVRPSRTGT